MGGWTGIAKRDPVVVVVGVDTTRRPPAHSPTTCNNKHDRNEADSVGGKASARLHQTGVKLIVSDSPCRFVVTIQFNTTP